MMSVVKGSKLLSQLKSYNSIGNILKYSRPASDIPGPKYYKFLGMLNDVITVGSSEKWEISCPWFVWWRQMKIVLEQTMQLDKLNSTFLMTSTTLSHLSKRHFHFNITKKSNSIYEFAINHNQVIFYYVYVTFAFPFSISLLSFMSKNYQH
jgi:hypothetical protein